METFGSFSGLLMNKNKTEGIWVGKFKHRKDKIKGKKKPLKHWVYILVTIKKNVKNITGKIK
jgi:hypothetical protein